MKMLLKYFALLLILLQITSMALKEQSRDIAVDDDNREDNDDDDAQSDTKIDHDDDDNDDDSDNETSENIGDLEVYNDKDYEDLDQ